MFRAGAKTAGRLPDSSSDRAALDCRGGRVYRESLQSLQPGQAGAVAHGRPPCSRGPDGANRLAVDFDHTIVAARDGEASAQFLADILGLSAPAAWGPFHVVRTANRANIDFMTVAGEIVAQHYAFLVSEPEFDAIFARIGARGLPFWADPGQARAGEINRHDGGRGVYFEHPDGHLLEIITRPYGSGGWNP